MLNTTDATGSRVGAGTAILDEDVLSLVEASKVLPLVNGRRVDPSSVWRWARKGLNGCRLEYARIGRRIVTSREALTRFTEHLAAADTEQPAVVAKKTPRRDRSRTDTQRERAIAKAESELEVAGG